MRKTIDLASLIPVFAALLPILTGGAFSADAQTDNPYFAVQVVDRKTGRGVPLVELRTTNQLRYYTDSNGIVAFREPGLMNREVFFHVGSHGYEYPKDGFGYRGVRLMTTPGITARIEIDRVNIAERLYRVTGQGIYRDSVLVGRSAPLEHPVLDGQVVGQDSVFTCRYRDQIFWLWGDTSRPSYPLGHFATAGAVSDLPGHGGLDPSIGVNLRYYVDDKGFSRPVAPMDKPGLVWLEALLTVPDPQGNERMIAKYARLKDLGHVLERGLMVFNDTTNTFEPLLRCFADLLPYRNTGHAFPVQVKGRPYYYFTSPSPMGSRLRVRATWDDVTDPNRYEVLTALVPGATEDDKPHWVTFAEVLAAMDATKAGAIEALEKEAKDVQVYDVASGQAIRPHNGTVYFNAHRQRWIGIFVQQFGETSALGEVWYAEADTPVGPWAYARKIVTHNKYSFYNPKQHPLFDQDGGRTIYFEGTYSYTFSGSEETATPRYDYNQIMYRLNLDDPRLVLPVPVYRAQDEEVPHALRLGKDSDTPDRESSVAFFAVEPNRADENLVPIYVDSGRLTTKRPAASSEAFFYALPVAETPSENTGIVNLYEYRRTDSGECRYETTSGLSEEGWRRAEKPLCRVWRSPSESFLIDTGTGPVGSN